MHSSPLPQKREQIVSCCTNLYQNPHWAEMQLFSLKKLMCFKSGANQKTKFLKMPLTHSNVLSRTLLAAGWEIINRMS